MFHSSEIPLSVLVTGPVNYKGTYTCSSASTAETWSWYFDGAAKDSMPHFTVGSRDDGKDGWYRFHVTLPIQSGGGVFNAHLFYIIGNGTVRRRHDGFTNRADLPGAEQGRLDAALQKDGALLDELAYRFFYGALRGRKSARAIAEAQRTGKDAFGKPVFRG